MAIEIERKFLVRGEQWRKLATGTIYRQGYIPTKNSTTVRVRLIGEQGYITIKSSTVGISRSEYEYPIPLEDAQEMLDNLCDRPLIEKTRYKLQVAGLTWEIDEFSGENEGLILAEVEISDEKQTLEIPEWIGQEVSNDPRYFNVNLVKYPFKEWSQQVTF